VPTPIRTPYAVTRFASVAAFDLSAAGSCRR
jgi:hypothetical protein